MFISIHALREEGDRAMHRMPNPATHFNPRPPRGGRQPLIRLYNPDNKISIHALREEGDSKRDICKKCCKNFNPRPPRGGRLCASASVLGMFVFQSTPSARRATLSVVSFAHVYIFQSTPSARRATLEA